jgi:hypothetical protein
MKLSNLNFRAVCWIVLVAALLIILFFYLKQDSRGPQYGQEPNSTTFSTAANGFALLYEVLDESNYQVRRSLQKSSPPLKETELLIITDPILSLKNKPSLIKHPNIFLILPKWEPILNPLKPSWLMFPIPSSTEDSDKILTAFLGQNFQGQIVQKPAVPGWIVNPFGKLKPTVVTPAQLLNSPDITPVIADEDGILLGQYRDVDRTVWILTDPDVMNNHGLEDGQNLPLTLAVLNSLGGSGTLVFDDPTQEPIKVPLNLDNPFTFPQIITILLTVLSAVCLFYSSGSRFGPPYVPEDSVDFGRRKLIDNSARLLERSGHHKVTLLNYLKIITKPLGKTLHAPPGLSENKLYNWLDDYDPLFGLKNILETVTNANPKTPEARLVAWAKTVYVWKARVESGSESGRQHN